MVRVTAVQLTFDDCTPDWPHPNEPDTHRPSRWACREDEMCDLSGQGAGPFALRTAVSIDVQEYL